MSILIDMLYLDVDDRNMTEISGRWYIAKPLPFTGICFKRWRRNFRNAWLVLRGKAIAVHYKEDEKLASARKYYRP